MELVEDHWNVQISFKTFLKIFNKERAVPQHIKVRDVLTYDLKFSSSSNNLQTREIKSMSLTLMKKL